MDEESRQGLKVVEFFGVPGVGKSHLVRRAAPENAKQPMNWFNEGGRARRIRRKAALMLRHLEAALAATLWARKVIGLYSPMGWRRSWKVLFNWVFVDCLIREAARGRSPVVVLNQGIAQALWSTKFGAGHECPCEEVRSLVRLYLERLPISEWCVVWVNAPLEVVQKRLEGREGCSPLDRDTGSMAEAHCAEREVGKVLNNLMRSANSRPTISVVNLENDDEGAASRLKGVMGWIEGDVAALVELKEQSENCTS